MRTTLRIDDDILAALKEGALEQGVSLTRYANSVLRRGLEASSDSDRRRRRRYREPSFSMGRPRVDLTKALALAGELEDEAAVEKLERRK